MDKQENLQSKKEIRKPEMNSGTKNDHRGLLAGIVTSGILLLILGAVFVFTSRKDNQAIAQLETQNTILNQQVGEHDSLVNDWVRSMADIEQELRTLQGKEEALIEQSIGPEITPSLRKNIMGEIEGIHQQLDNNRAEIARLHAKLEKSGMKIASLNKQIKSLEANLAMRDSSLMVLRNNVLEKDVMLADLNTTVDSLNSNILAYEGDISQYETMVDLQNEELNKAFIATGNIKELRENGVVEKKGGFLGLGKSKTVKEDLIDSNFDRVQISETTKIDLNAKKARLISEHPTGSYTMVENDSTVALEIIDPAKFWKITRYAVVETRK